MKCQNCNEREANYHFKQLINGHASEVYLCADCAAKLGYDNNLMGAFGMGTMLSQLFGLPQQAKAPAVEQKCPMCGATMREISQSGKIGCAQCYSTFRDSLLPSINRIHGNVRHVGRVPGTAGQVSVKRQMEQLKEELTKCIGLQEFERAAELRDKIKELERQEGGEDAKQ